MSDLPKENAVWNALTEDQQIAATCVVLKAALDHARDGGSFRYLIYDRLGFSPAAYYPIYISGGMAFSNECTATREDERPDSRATAALALVEKHAISRPMVDSGHKRDNGSDIQTPSQERHEWFDALWTLGAAIAEADIHAEVINRQRAEILAIVQNVPPLTPPPASAGEG